MGESKRIESGDTHETEPKPEREGEDLSLP